MNNSVSNFAAALVLAIGLAASGYFIHQGLVHFRGGERGVSVRGVAERDVRADVATWAVQYTVTDNDLAAAQKLLDEHGVKVEAFLKKQGLQESEVRVMRVDVADLLAQQFRPDNIQSGRYILTKTYMVRSQNVDLIDTAFRQVGDLIAQGVILTQGQGPSYLFTKLNDIKPEMIAQATKNAREGAQKFAEDSGARVGGIKDASQGLFQIIARDDDNAAESSVIDKRVRVVTTVEYYLE